MCKNSPLQRGNHVGVGGGSEVVGGCLTMLAIILYTFTLFTKISRSTGEASRLAHKMSSSICARGRVLRDITGRTGGNERFLGTVSRGVARVVFN